MSSKTRPRTTQSALGFSAKKSIHKSPTKKKAPAPLFTRPNRSATAFSGTNPFLDDDDAKKGEKPQPAVERDEFGFLRTVPLDYSPLGKGKPTEQMIANLVGEKAKEDEELKEEKGEVDESDEGGDRAFFLIEKRGMSFSRKPRRKWVTQSRVSLSRCSCPDPLPPRVHCVDRDCLCVVSPW
jgi:hypothetical protein